MTKVKPFYTFLAFFLFLSACTPNNSTVDAGLKTATPVLPTATIEPSVTITPNPTITSTIVPSPTYTPTAIPTLPVEQARTKLLELLANNGGCRLPCLWGITPGKSTSQEAQAILAPLSSIAESIMTDFDVDGGAIFPDYIEDNLMLHTIIGFNSENQIVSRISFHAQQEKKTVTSNGEPSIAEIYDSRIFSKRASSYMLPQVLSEHGIPSAVLIQTFNALFSLGHRIGGGFDIIILYPDQGLLVHYTTQLQVVGKMIRGCPANAHVELELYPAGHSDTFAQLLSQTQWSGIWPLPVNKPYWTPVEDATNMSLEQFYKTFRQPTTQCIETPAKLWAAPFR